MKRVARAIVIGTISIGVAAGVAVPASAASLCNSDWSIPKACPHM